MKTSTFLLIGSVLLFFSSCGGGGGSSGGTNNDTPNLQTGTFVDSAVSGLDYICGTRSGTTNNNGEFQYQLGDTCTFSLGDFSLGTLSAKNKITPSDLSSNKNTITNIGILLQSLDQDNNLDNGITITQSKKDEISSQHKTIDVSSYNNIKSTLEKVKTDLGDTNMLICTKDEARRHLQSNGVLAKQYADLTSTTIINNAGAYVTSQCYTKTVDVNNTVHNPCFACHINSVEPNYVNDWDLQQTYDFGEYTKINRWTNLFKDRTKEINATSDEDILSYVRENNYLTSNNQIILAKTLTQNLPKEWDFAYNGSKDGKWSGYIPDCYYNFDNKGFDINPNTKEYTGWRAFAYYPFLGTFWPTNGSTDDVLIRLPKVLQEDTNGKFNKEVYKINLSIVESLIKKKDIPIKPIDESLYNVDLNQNGKIDTANEIVYNWITPTYDYDTKKYKNYSMHYVGLGYQAQIDNDNLNMAPGVYPQNTEFLHTVRYLNLDENNTITLAPRIKELRYAKKTTWNTYSQLSNATMADIKEKDAFPDRLRTIVGNEETGLKNGLGWTYQGFIEDKEGDLRPQTYEETLYCIGCHSGIGATVDNSFAFPRKLDTKEKAYGWYHWSQSGLKGISEPKMTNGDYEYTKYLSENLYGDEFRSNYEVKEKFFNADNTLKQSEIDKVHNDISYLLFPSKQRALQLDKAYKIIVDEQSFIYGRDTVVSPVTNVHKVIPTGDSTGVTSPVLR